MPKYVTFMKEIMSNKRKLDAYGTMSLSDNCSSIIQTKLPKKLKKPCSFTIPCTIRQYAFSRALCDLGESISLMPLSIVKKLNLVKISQAINLKYQTK